MTRAFKLLRRRPWPIVFALGLVVMFGWVWTRDDPEGHKPGVRAAVEDPVRAAEVELWSTVQRTAQPLVDHLNRDTWAREIVPIVLADRTSGEPLSMGWPEGLDPGPAARDSIVGVLDQPDLVPLVDHDVAVGLHIVSVSPSSLDFTPETTLLGSQDGQPFCIRIHASVEGATEADVFLRPARLRHARPGTRWTRLSRFRTDLLGVCTFVRRFGMPGEHIRAWLGARGATAQDLSDYVSRGYQARTGPGATADVLDVAGILSGEFFDAGVHVIRRACRAGDRSACMREFFPDGASPGPTGSTIVVEQAHVMFVTGIRGDLPSRLEAEFGSDAFLRFWASDAPFEAAFEAAFGVHPADWVHQTSTDLSGVVRAGPLPSTGPAGTSVLLMILGLAIGALAALRRRVA